MGYVVTGALALAENADGKHTYVYQGGVLPEGTVNAEHLVKVGLVEDTEKKSRSARSTRSGSSSSSSDSGKSSSDSGSGAGDGSGSGDGSSSSSSSSQSK